MERAFFLANNPSDGTARLLEEDANHARRVLRMQAGDALTGLDGRGGRWPLAVRDTSGGRLAVEVVGQPAIDPEPGAPGSSIPWIEVAVALPKEKRAEQMLDRLTQLGLGSLAPLAADRTQGPLRELSPSRRRRLERTAREACKQSGRAWLPQIAEPSSVEDWLARRADAPIALLDPGADARILAWAAELPIGCGRRDRPLCLLVGPEGGFTPAEAARAADAGARGIRLGPHILRIETAAEAALAGLVQAIAN